MEPTFVKTDEATLKETESEVATVLLHQKKLLRLKNWLRSPLLRLPRETIVHILSYIMEHVEQSAVWQPIFSTCHHIHSIMRTAPELWWKINFRSAREAHIAFLRSKGSPQVVIAELAPWNLDARIVLDCWKDKRMLHGQRLYRLELCGYASDIGRFDWIFERPLPRLNRLKIHFAPSLSMPDQANLQLPIALQPPMDMPLRALDLRNTVLPWSSNIFTGLSELHLDFRDCDNAMEIPGDELLRILGASPQLERLSLMRVGPKIPIGNVRPSANEQIIRFPRLATLELDNTPEVIGYISAHTSTPALNSLQIRSLVPSWNLTRSLDLLLPDDLIQKRLFPNPPVFEIETAADVLFDLMIVNIGKFKIWFDFDLDDVETARNIIMTRIQPLVPPSVTTLKMNFSELGFDGLEWREFLSSHTELRSVECSQSSWEPVADSLWEALSPSGADGVVLCPGLESISLFDHPSEHLHNCLLNRRNAGFKLKYLKVKKTADGLGLAEEFKHLVEAFEVDGPNNHLTQEVRPFRWEEHDV